jgi:hypothetical protein
MFMIVKRPIRPDRLRQVPAGFNWVDHRLVRLGHIGRCDHSALALYLFLVTVADVQGVSYYSDAAIRRRLNMTDALLATARRQLIGADLLAYQKPLYQVLSLDSPAAPSANQENRCGQAQSAADILRRALQGTGGTA